MNEMTYAMQPSVQLSGVTCAPLCADRSADAAWYAVAPTSKPFAGREAALRDRHAAPRPGTTVDPAVRILPAGIGLGRAASGFAPVMSDPTQPGSRSCRPPV